MDEKTAQIRITVKPDINPVGLEILTKAVNLVLVFPDIRDEDVL